MYRDTYLCMYLCLHFCTADLGGKLDFVEELVNRNTNASNILQVISKTNSFEIPGNLEMLYSNVFKTSKNFVTEQTMPFFVGVFF